MLPDVDNNPDWSTTSAEEVRGVLLTLLGAYGGPGKVVGLQDRVEAGPTLWKLVSEPDEGGYQLFNNDICKPWSLPEVIEQGYKCFGFAGMRERVYIHPQGWPDRQYQLWPREGAVCVAPESAVS